MTGEDKQILDIKKRLYIMGLKELLEKNIIVGFIDKDTEVYVPTLEYQIFIRMILSDLCPISRKDLYKHVDDVVSKILKKRGFEIKLNFLGRESLRCMVCQVIDEINTPEDSFPKLVNVLGELSKVDVF